MSDILNHIRCAKESLFKLNKDDPLLEIIVNNYDLYRLGSQGPDFFYYYLSPKNIGSVNKIGKIIHTSSPNAFFKTGFEYLEEFPEHKNLVLAYLSGFASHYALDVSTHPFIFSMTNSPEKPLESSGLHKIFEAHLDTAMASFYDNKKAIDLLPEKAFIIRKENYEFLESFYKYILKKLYNISLSSETVKKALNYAAKIIIFSHDPEGKKKKNFKKIEKLVGLNHVVSKIFYPSSTDEEIVLNLKNVSWPDPVSGEIHNESYPQLFSKAVDNTVKSLELISQSIQEGNTDFCGFLDFIQNKSYLTGKDINDNAKFSFWNDQFRNFIINNY